MTDTAIDPHHTALLVMDYQNGIVGSLDGAETLLANAGEAIEQMRSRGGQIGYVRVAFADGEVEAMPATARMAGLAAGAGEALHADSPTTAIHDRVAPQEGDIVVRKTRVGPFLTTDLDEQLRARGVDTLILAGVSTSGVVLSTVRDAHDRDYRLFVLADATADRDPEVHAFLTERVFPRQADVIAVADLEALLSGATPGS